MVFYTAKFSKGKAVIALLLLGVVLVAIILLAGGQLGKAAETAALSAVVKDNDDRVGYLASFGWEVDGEPVDEQTITIPHDFSDVYGDYNAIQLEQGFDLRNYAGREAVRYTYEVKNYPSTSEKVYADIIVFRQKVIAGDIQSAALDGFMHGLRRPDSQ